MTTHDTSPTTAGRAPGAGAAAGGGTGATDAAPVPPSAPATRVRPQPRGWALAGIAAGVTGLVGIQASMALGVNWEETAGDADAIVADLSGRTGALLVFHTATIVSALLAVVFAAGLSRRLSQQAPAGSLLGPVAGAGLLLVSVAGLLGSGLDTQFMFGFADVDLIVPESGAFFSDWIATIPWLWVGAGLSGVAVAVAALRHAAAPRWLGWVGAVLGGLTLLLGISPLQYMAGFTGPLWLLVTAIGFAAGDRR
ncbi:hypothetical protein MHY85_09470 [Cellulomonas sp. ACRRI]|uniref:hypothetical protein n=1 Tax=Cellulomonas sp. ACRRI TaxID=2918188 RepID=UPI001EF3955B|nr:hypothetical protein [Cellulomonas sp. ACRRI]MCG7286199.1 hypothetical protein [Cellulomonas sp. ACRRI]